MEENLKYKIEKVDISLFTVAIVGGGLAGLSLSILLAKAGHKVVLFEKEKYPFHKVCGEYISMESWNFLERLGLNLAQLNLPFIKKLLVSSPNGHFIKSDLDPGGFGISRYYLDNRLKEIASESGVTIHDETKVNEVLFEDEIFLVKISGGQVEASMVAGSFGKKSNLDVKWQRDFIRQKPNKLNNYIGVKYHVKYDSPNDTIALHNFDNGYCGISKIEENKYCLCYLTTAKNLNKNEGSIKKMEEKVLCRNPFLNRIFSEAQFLFSEPVTISQISFDKKTQVQNHLLMTGDAAGMITPLCGNGMSMALHSSKIAFDSIDLFLAQKITREEMENRYASQWQQEFSSRLRNGRMIQKLFGKVTLTNFFVRSIKHFPFLIQQMIRATHGREF